MVEVVIRDLGIALLLASTLTFLIELYARSRLQDEIRTGVVEAAFARLISPKIFEEVKNHVMGAKTLREEWTIRMNLYRDDSVQGVTSDHYLSNTVVSYRLRNMSNSIHHEKIRAGLDLDVVAHDAIGSLPRFKQVTIGNRVYVGAELQALLSGDPPVGYETVWPIPPGKDVAVVNEILEVIKVPDTFDWHTPHQAVGARIEIDASAVPTLQFDVSALHPDRERLQTIVEGRSWYFSDGILPWQGFQIETKYVKPVGPTKEVPEAEKTKAPAAAAAGALAKAEDRATI